MRVRRRDDRGSALALVPAGFLVFVLLAALAVDSAAAYLGQQQLRDALAAAASDAVTAGLSNRSYYDGGAVEVDPAAAARAACVDVGSQSDGDLRQLKLWISTSAHAVQLEATATVDAVFGRAIPGFAERTVRASAQAVVSSGPGAGPAGGGSADQAATTAFAPLDCG